MTVKSFLEKVNDTKTCATYSRGTCADYLEIVTRAPGDESARVESSRVESSQDQTRRERDDRFDRRVSIIYPSESLNFTRR